MSIPQTRFSLFIQWHFLNGNLRKSVRYTAQTQLLNRWYKIRHDNIRYSETRFRMHNRWSRGKHWRAKFPGTKKSSAAYFRQESWFSQIYARNHSPCFPDMLAGCLPLAITWRYRLFFLVPIKSLAVIFYSPSVFWRVETMPKAVYSFHSFCP